MHMLHFPSTSGADYDFFAVIPENMPLIEATTMANQVIVQTNREDRENDGCCLDGRSVEDNIKSTLSAAGFCFPSEETGTLAVTTCWDAD